MDIDTLIAKDNIRETIYRYCRMLDRMDKEGASELWNDDSTAIYHGMYEGTGPGFIDWVWKAHAGMDRHSHQISNVIIEVDGDTAVSESYVTVALWMRSEADGEVREITARGRYLDRWSRQCGRNGKKRWGIDHREHVLDMHTVETVSAGEVADASRRDTLDPSYSFLKGGE